MKSESSPRGSPAKSSVTRQIHSQDSRHSHITHGLKQKSIPSKSKEKKQCTSCSRAMESLKSRGNCTEHEKTKIMLSSYTKILSDQHRLCLKKYLTEIEECVITNFSNLGCGELKGDMRCWDDAIQFLKLYKDCCKSPRDVAQNVFLVAYLESDYNLKNPEKRMEGLELFLQFGASPDSLHGIARPLQVAFQRSNIKAVQTLLSWNADLSLMTNCEFTNSTIFHLALAMGLKAGSFEIFERCCKEVNSDFKNLKDPDGNSLLHIIAKLPPTDMSMRAIDMLCKCGVEPNMVNASGKKPIQLLKKNDARYAVLKEASKLHDTEKSGPKFDRQISDTVYDAKGKKIVAHKPAETTIDDVKECEGRLKMAILLLQEQHSWKERQKKDLKQKGNGERKLLQADGLDDLQDNGAIDVANPDTLDIPQTSESSETVDNFEKGQDEELIDNECMKIDFNKLEWEVECTAEVWKTLRSRNIKRNVKEQIVRKIELLATGEWRTKLRKPLEGVPEGIKLFEARVDQKVRILWECAIAFSSRRSEAAEKRLGCDTEETVGITGGKIYSEIIRVWRIVFDHDNVNRIKESVIKSIVRGSSCIVQKKLRGRTSKIFSKGDETKIAIPMLFTECTEEDSPTVLPLSEEAKHFPPASANDAEFNIMKFYSFSSSLVTTVLSDTTGKVDFPFHVSELEDAIIKLKSKSAILLLGRSGTGKTTCCVYRLWSSFVRYWTVAQMAEPLMPRPSIMAKQDVACESSVPTTDSVAKSSNNIQCSAHTNDTDHLHQVFVTKNVVLCTEVKKNFLDICHGNPVAAHYVECDDKSLPNNLQNVPDAAYPLFVTSKQFLILLDGSLPAPHFFRRDADGNLIRPIEGWKLSGEEDLIPDLHDPFEYEEDSDDENENEEEQLLDAQNQMEEVKDLRRHVTFEVFTTKLWPKIKQSGFQASLVWEEIMSFIKGSIEALETSEGCLTKEVYLEMGRKRAPNYSHLREKIYELFQTYQKLLRRHAMFDECDVVFHIYSRMRSQVVPQWFIHEIYVDETQDFTQGELSLLIGCCSNPNDMFLTGDTAQNIMRGISFRFKDLKSLFYYAQKSGFKDVCIPKTVHTLTYNYRSHEGVLGMAASVVELMTRYFPESFDKLNKDQGLFHGPKPVLFESCNFDDLALILRSNIRQTSHIELGANQVILVADDAARDRLPEELNLCLALTIYEAKGLEFDDIFIYNFFKDSQVSKEWRVVSGYLQEMEQDQASDTKNRKEIEEINIDEQSDDKEAVKSRPLDFEKAQHQILISEFKSLYTAITRARVNVWIFDEDEEKRAPMFEYCKKRGVAEVIRMRTDKGTEGAMSEQLNERLFMVPSTQSDWKKRGDEFHKNKLFKVAAKAYAKAGDKKMEGECLAHIRSQNIAAINSPKKRREEYMFIAELFFNCEQYELAAKCLLRAKQLNMAAELYFKIGMYESSAKLYTHTGAKDEALKSLEKQGNYRKAVKILWDKGNADSLELALKFVQQYEMAEKNKEPGVRRKPHMGQLEILRQLIKVYRREGHLVRLLNAVKKLDSKREQLDILNHHISSDACLDYAVELLKSQGNIQEAALLFRKAGKLYKAAEISEQKLFQAQCYLAVARKNYFEGNVGEEELKTAMTHSEMQRGNDELYAEASLLAAFSEKADSKKKDYLADAFRLYKKSHHALGMLESLSAMKSSEETDYCRKIVFTIGELHSLLSALQKERSSSLETRMISSCLQHWGLSTQASVLGDNEVKYKVLIHEGPRYPQYFGNQTVVGEQKYRDTVIGYLRKHAVRLKQDSVERLEKQVKGLELCEKHIAGYTCNEESHIHKRDFQTLMLLVQNQVTSLMLNSVLPSSKPSDSKTPFDNLIETVFPTAGPNRSIDSYLVQEVQNQEKAIDVALKYLNSFWDINNKDMKWSYTDGYILLLKTYLLFGKERNDIGNRIARAEREYTELSKKSGQPLNCGMKCIMDKSGGNSKYYVCYIRNLLSYFENLHTKCDPFEALGKMNQFFGSICFRPVDPFFPSIANACCLLEQECVLCLAMYASYGQRTVLLPASYLKQVKLWDSLNYKKRNFWSMFATVQSYKIRRGWEAQLNQRGVEYMFKLICGQISHQFNIILDSFSNDSFLKSGETERVLVLCLVLLCNCGLAFPWAYHRYIREALSSIDIDPSLSYPPRVLDCLKGIVLAVYPKDVARILSNLLQVRDDEFLYTCRWSWEMHTRGVRGFKYEKRDNYNFLPNKYLPFKFGKSLMNLIENPSSPDTQQLPRTPDDHQGESSDNETEFKEKTNDVQPVVQVPRVEELPRNSSGESHHDSVSDRIVSDTESPSLLSSPDSSRKEDDYAGVEDKGGSGDHMSTSPEKPVKKKGTSLLDRLKSLPGRISSLFGKSETDSVEETKQSDEIDIDQDDLELVKMQQMENSDDETTQREINQHLDSVFTGFFSDNAIEEKYCGICGDYLSKVTKHDQIPTGMEEVDEIAEDIGGVSADENQTEEISYELHMEGDKHKTTNRLFRMFYNHYMDRWLPLMKDVDAFLDAVVNRDDSTVESLHNRRREFEDKLQQCKEDHDWDVRVYADSDLRQALREAVEKSSQVPQPEQDLEESDDENPELTHVIQQAGEEDIDPGDDAALVKAPKSRRQRKNRLKRKRRK